MKRRVYALMAVLLVMTGAAVRSAALAARSPALVSAVAGQSLYRLDVAADRGTIYDTSLRPLTNRGSRTVCAVAPTIETIGALDQATGGAQRERLADALEAGKPFLFEPGDLDRVTLNRLAGLVGLDLFTVPERYSRDQPAAHVIGILDSLGGGASGVELAMNDVLAGSGGEARVTYPVDALGRVLAGGDRQVVDTLGGSAAGVALTLDGEIQAMAEAEAQRLGKGAVVVTRVPDCAVLAMVSVPGFSPLALDQALEREDSPLLNRALCAYAPGSVFKLVAAAAALESGIALPEFTCTGSVSVEGLSFACYGGLPHGQVDLSAALERSCNGYFINLGRSLGGQSLLSMAYNLGLGDAQEFGRGLFSAAGELPDAAALTNPRALANFSFGQGELTVTPLQMCGVVNAIAAGGIYHSPSLILGTVDRDGRLSPSSPVTARSLRVMSKHSAAVLQEAMRGAARQGTARPGAPEDLAVAAKTGTAQTGVWDEQGRELLNFWYCGYLAIDGSPAYAVTVLSEGTPDDGGATAQVFRSVCQHLSAQGAPQA